jgi:6-phosphogluconolactonase (cycloisomerase 2 family)
LVVGLLAVALTYSTRSHGAPRVKPQFVYAHENALQRRIWAFKLGGAGELTPLPNSPFAVAGSAYTGGGPTRTAAYSSSKKTLFVTGFGGVSSLKVAKSGQLKAVSGSPFGSTPLLGIAAVDLGKKTYVYAADPEGDRIIALTVASSGKLTPVAGSPFDTGDRPITVTAVGGLLFVVNGAGRSISTFRIAANGALTPAPGSPFALVDSTLPFGLAATATGPYVYAADCLGLSQIFSFAASTSTGALTVLPSSPMLAPTADVCAGLTPVGSSLLYGFQFEGTGFKDIQAFRSEANGALTPLGGLQSSGTGVDLAAASPSGNYLIVARSQGNQALRSFRISPETGALSPAGTQSPDWNTVDGLVTVQP